MKKEFNLSDKIEEHGWAESKENPTEPSQYGEVLWVEDVKEFTRLIKSFIEQREREFIESILPNLTENQRCELLNGIKTKLSDQIDKLAGERLI